MTEEERFELEARLSQCPDEDWGLVVAAILLLIAVMVFDCP